MVEGARKRNSRIIQMSFGNEDVRLRFGVYIADRPRGRAKEMLARELG